LTTRGGQRSPLESTTLLSIVDKKRSASVAPSLRRTHTRPRSCISHLSLRASLLSILAGERIAQQMSIALHDNQYVCPIIPMVASYPPTGTARVKCAWCSLSV
jgi:hypothetical protein